jgi:hypothetical protein
MTAQEIIGHIETIYKNSELTYEMMFVHFANLSGVGFQLVTIKRGSPILRARYSKNLKSFQSFTEISYPKIEHVRDFSRLNRPRQNIFYASETEKACLTEMLPFWFDEFKTGDIISVTLSKWILQNDLKLLIIPDANNTNEFNKTVRQKLEPQEIEFWNYISKKFKTSTKQDKKIYEFTSAYSNALWLTTLSQKINASGFIYSSVQSPDSVNIAISTKIIDRKELIPTEVVETKFQRKGTTNNGLPSYQEIGERKNGFVSFGDGKINWI